jgi:hypothetical protein
MRATGIVLLCIAILLLIADTFVGIVGRYQFNSTIGSYWHLADKASTIPQKSTYLDKFVTALEASGLQGNHDAIILCTPNNSFDENIKALKSLQLRLHEIQGMDVTSFSYQTAIQQITAQEQGEATAMLSVFYGIWWKTHHFFLWNWVCLINIILLAVIGFVGIALIIEGY